MLATSFHEVYACDVESGGVERVFSKWTTPVGGEFEVLLNVSMHDESVTGDRRC
jgi:hypothetical protein